MQACALARRFFFRTMSKFYSLGNDRFVQVSDDNDVFNLKIVELGSDYQQNIDFSAVSWLNLLSVLGQIDEAVNCLLNEEHVFVEISIGRKTYVSLMTDYLFVDIREFYYSKTRREVLATERGISLTFAEWDTLKNIMSEVSTDFPILSSTVLCRDNPNHQNLQGALNCQECNPFHYEEHYFFYHPI